MDWTAAIETNREALKRVLAMLVAMAGITGRQSAVASRQSETAPDGPSLTSPDCPLPTADCRPTLPRHLHRAILRLLRPAESAARRLVIVAARDVVVTLPPPRPRKAKQTPTILRNGVGTGILMPRGFSGPLPLTVPGRAACLARPSDPHKGEGDVRVAQGSAVDASSAKAAIFPSPLRGGVRGGGKPTSRLGFQLFDRLPPPFPLRRAARSGVPRICFPGYANPFPVAPRLPLSPRDPIDAGRLKRRLAALAAALDDLPRQARRFARWRARARADATSAQNQDSSAQNRDCDAAGAQNNENPRRRPFRRVWPLRPGRPPGWRRKPVHEAHEILNVVHGLAIWALQSPDTS